MNGNVFKPFFDVSQHTFLQPILGPIHTPFNSKTGYHKGPVTSKEKKIFGCGPLNGTAVTILGFIKSDKIDSSIFIDSVNMSADSCVTDGDDDGWDTDDNLETDVKSISKNPLKCISRSCQHKFTQTSTKEFQDFNIENNHCVQPPSVGALYSLVDCLCNLLSVLTQLKQQIAIKNHCHHCH